MICLLQRVQFGKVEVQKQCLGEIQHGLVVLVGFEPHDHSEKLQKMAHRLLHYRIFSDENNKMNLNVQQVNGGVLLVPQFTLAANTQNGLRPSFSTSASPTQATLLFDEFIAVVKHKYPQVQTGQFGADMQVTLCNDGPVTFWLQN
ncbi:D-aminoacyl-tRNA deacylase [Thiosulfatimonas sediminis]|uniref:D-aminoacyl-tRNA deacylase n=1 Tax=Thiosulfatimonas sediminis TaxID=2675054 RepID=A0A6F8PRS8_9GAMM|nr:D-aminoacyl-tRNA deacylase [Thiosulfatimonas sediminis]BBP44833.1 D-aminoacyl-tRNA deacylase [Thiosulfatimonas sediminis]